jgi:cytochrome c-type biogenesis protein CcmH/NrfF
MAEIRVEPKKRATPVWIWVVLALVLVGVIAYFLIRNKRSEESNTTNKPAPTSYISSPGTGHLLANI